MTENNLGKRPPRFKKILGVPTLKTYPIEGMERGIKIGGGVGAIVGMGLWIHWSQSFDEIGLLVAGGFALIGSIIGILLGALTDKLRGKWDS
jgi:hypothetical protein